MAKKRTEKTEPVESAPAAHRGRFARYCFLLLLAGVLVLLWLSLLTFSPTDPPADAQAGDTPISNAAGAVGAHVAYTLLWWLGGGAYVGVTFVTVVTGIMLVRRRPSELPWRILGAGVLTVAAAAGIFLMDPDRGREVWVCSAGIVGGYIGGLLLQSFSQTGGWIILTVGFCIGLILAADRILLSLWRLVRRLWGHRSRLKSIAQALPVGKSPASPQPSARAVAPAAPAPEKPERPAPRLRPQPAPPVVASPRPAEAKRPPAPKRQRPADREYELPSADLLKAPTSGYSESQEAQAIEKREILQQTLNDFGVGAEVVGHMTGPVITMFELSLEPGVKVAAVARLANDISRALAVPGVRVVSPLPGRDTIGIEVPNLEKEIVRIRELMDMVPGAEEKMHIPLYLGKDAEGSAIVTDLAGMPHMLIAGTTGSGKSVCINAIIMAILMKRRPEDVRLILVDPKMVEMAAFENVPHLLCPIVNDMRRAEDILEWAATKMDERYELLKEAGVRNIASFNKLSPSEIHERLGVETEEEKARVPTRIPYYVVIVDELADLIMTSSKEVEGHIIRIAQKARAVGIHLILATQRPSVNVVTGLIKSNMPCRASFRVASRQESRIVLDQNGADVLLGQGDMLFLAPGTSTLVRAQGTYVEDSEIRAIVTAFTKEGQPVYNPELLRMNTVGAADAGGEKDELFDKAVEVVLATQRGSVSLLQRRLSVGYSRASRIIDQMADSGILGDYKGSQARECMITLEDWEQMKQSIVDDQSGASSINGDPTSA
jgi:DNA segregation ATPase FtsK/SpoIIIE, S-DNA-T family